MWKQIEAKKEQQRLEREEKLRQIEEEKKRQEEYRQALRNGIREAKRRREERRKKKLERVREEEKTEKNQDTQFKEKMKLNNCIYKQKIQERYKNTGILYKAKVDIDDGLDIKYLGSTCPTIKGTHTVGGIKHTSSTFKTLAKYHDSYSGYYEHNLSLSSAYAFEDEKYIEDILKEFGY